MKRWIKLWWHCLLGLRHGIKEDHRMCTEGVLHELWVMGIRWWSWWEDTEYHCTCGYRP